MLRRCPYCGEKTFSLAAQWGINVSFDAVDSPAFRSPGRLGKASCRHCLRYCSRQIGKVKWGVFLDLLLFIIPLLMIVGMRLKWWTLLVGVMLLVIFYTVYFLINYFCVHFDKDHKKEQQADNHLRLVVDEPKLLKKKVRKWDVCLIRLPRCGVTDVSPRMYGMVCGFADNGGKQEVLMRIVRTEELEAPQIGETAWLVAPCDYVFNAVVAEVAPPDKGEN